MVKKAIYVSIGTFFLFAIVGCSKQYIAPETRTENVGTIEKPDNSSDSEKILVAETDCNPRVRVCED